VCNKIDGEAVKIWGLFVFLVTGSSQKYFCKGGEIGS